MECIFTDTSQNCIFFLRCILLFCVTIFIVSSLLPAQVWTCIVLLCVSAQPVLMKQQVERAQGLVGQSMVLSCNPPKSSPPPSIHWMNISECADLFPVPSVSCQPLWHTDSLCPLCLLFSMTDLLCLLSYQLIEAAVQQSEVLVVHFKSKLTDLILHWHEKHFHLPLQFPCFELYFPPTLNCPRPSDLMHITRSERVTIGLDGKLYFANLMRSDSKEDYICHAQYREARTILPATAVSLSVKPSERTHNAAHTQRSAHTNCKVLNIEIREKVSESITLCVCGPWSHSVWGNISQNSEDA